MSGEVKELVERLQGLLEKATKGPWSVGTGGCAVRAPDRTVAICSPHPRQDDGSMRANSTLIAAALNALPTLLDTLQSQERRIGDLLSALEPFADIADTLDGVGRDDESDDRIVVAQTHGCQLAELTEDHFRRARTLTTGGE